MGRNRGIGGYMARGTDSAFTLPELLITVALIGIVSVTSLPTLAGMVRGYRLRTAAWQVAGDLRLTRQKTVSSNRRHRVCFSNCGERVPVHGYLIQREENYRWETEATIQPPSQGVELTSNAIITFSQTGEAAGGTVTLVMAPRSFQVRTHFTGKVTVCGGSCP